MSTKETADYAGLAPQTLANWRYLGDRGPRFYRVGARVKYDQADVDRWLEDQAQQPTRPAA